ncbi:YceI family protein [Amaricoccus tamworthensis]|uniref:YceI family protein n=1 Tax=Amaricoccus tamworthensis TaxID=57002 RepID=UPI003C79CDB3
MKFIHLAAAAAISVAPLPAFAEWTLDKSHASIFFDVEHLGFSTVTGTFEEFDANITFDPEDLAATEVAVTIAADSVNTFFEARDEHVKNADFLDVANHPEITFVSTGIEMTGDNTAELTGDVTIKGTTNSETFDVVMNQVGENPFNPEQQVAGFTITGDIDRTDYGIDFGAPVIGAVLPVTINIELNN